MSKVPTVPKKRPGKNKKDRTLKILESIHEMLEKQNRMRTAFFMGIMRGLGTALGATVVLAILTSLAISLSSVFDISIFLDAFFGD